MNAPSLEELKNKIEQCLQDKSTILGLIQRMYSNVIDYSISEPYSQLFKNLIDNRIIEEDDITNEYRSGLLKFHDELILARQRCIEDTPNSLLNEKCVISEIALDLFHSDFIVACTIRNWEDMKKLGFTQDEHKSLEPLIKFVFYAEKAKESKEKLEKLSYHSLFEDLPESLRESVAV